MSADPWFDAAIAFFWLPENDGQAVHVTPSDPGGATAWGVVFTYWSAYRRAHGEAFGYNDFAAAPRETFLPYLFGQYWNAVRAHELGAAGIVVFDMAATSGPGTAARLLQKVVKVDVDGAIGPKTLAAVVAVQQALLIADYSDARIDYYSRLATSRIFTGWVPRARRCRDYALKLAVTPVPAAVARPLA